eukprot:9333578-Alexandrium_andersonii.AAC.1
MSASLVGSDVYKRQSIDPDAAAEDVADGRTEVAEEVAGRHAHCVDLTLYKGNEWFIHTGRGAAVH